MRARIPAFTLVELLIAISITLLIVVLLSRIFAGAADAWRSSDQRIDVFRDARALQIISRDLSLKTGKRATALIIPDPYGRFRLRVTFDGKNP
jgi:type II secretory pathway component PulJ